MVTQFKIICKYDSKLMILEEILKSLEYVRTGEYKREDKEIWIKNTNMVGLSTAKMICH